MSKQELTKKEQSRQKKQEVLNSVSYQEWLKYRKNIHPFPANPYRAYMIDTSLRAEISRTEDWRGEVNRRDTRHDYPNSARWRTPQPTRRKTTRQPEKPPPKKRRTSIPAKPIFKPHPKSPRTFDEPKKREGELTRKEALQITREFTKKHGIPMPKRIIVSRSRGHLIGQMRTAYARRYGQSQSEGIPHPESSTLRIGVKGTSKAVAIATLLHELGHWKHAHETKTRGGFSRYSRMEKEQRATQIARGEIKDKTKKPVMSWSLRYGLETYHMGGRAGRGTLPREQTKKAQQQNWQKENDEWRRRQRAEIEKNRKEWERKHKGF